VRTIACLNLADGTVTWQQDKPRWDGHGSMWCGGKILFQNEGHLTMLSADRGIQGDGTRRSAVELVHAALAGRGVCA